MRHWVVVGDTVGLGLGFHYRPGLLGRRAVLRDAALVGCGISASSRPACADPVLRWDSVVRQYDPDATIVMLGVWDARPIPARDRTYLPGTEAYRRYLMRRLGASFNRLAARGGRVAMLTVPCYVPIVKSAAPKLEDIARFNQILRAAVAKADPSVKLIDYGNYICPNGHDQPTIDGTQMRYDGVHLTHDGAQKIWRWLAPQLPTRTR